MGFRWKKVLRFVAPIIAIAAPGIGTSIGYAILGVGDVIAGAALAGNIAAATGVSTITAASVVAATGAQKAQPNWSPQTSLTSQLLS